MKPGDKVFWTHVSRKGRTITLLRKVGTIVRLDDDSTAVVKTLRGRKEYKVRISGLAEARE